MRNNRKKLIAVFVITLVGLTACNNRNDEANRPADSTTAPSTGATPAKAEVTPKQVNDWIVLEDTTYIPVLDDFGRSLLDARANFVKKDNKAAAFDVEKAWAWVGQKAEAGTSDVIKDTRLVARKLITGAGYGAEEVGKGIEALGHEIERLGTKIKQS